MTCSFNSCALLFGLKRKGVIVRWFKATRSLVNRPMGLTPLAFVYLFDCPFVRGQLYKWTVGWSFTLTLLHFFLRLKLMLKHPAVFRKLSSHMNQHVYFPKQNFGICS